jgi:hypothetical protein
MAATIAQPKPITLFIICISFIAALAASRRPVQALDVNLPAAQAVPVAPAAPPASRTEATQTAVAVVAQPVPAPVAPVLPVAAARHPTGTSPDLPVTGAPLTLLAMAVAGGLLAAGTLTLRRAGPELRATC